MSNTQEKPDTPRLVLRTYKASDHEQIDHLYYSTYFTLVPEGVKCKLKSPVFWVGWIAFYSYLLAIVPILLSGMDFPSWASAALKIFLTFAWSVVSFAGVFVITDRFEVVEKVEQARQNDLSDPEVYYLNWTKEEVEINDDTSATKSDKKRVTFDKDAKPATELVRTQKPIQEQTPSHFWVLSLDNRSCGIIGLAHYDEKILSNRLAQPPAWKLLMAAALKRYHLPVPASLSNLQAKLPVPVFSEAHEPKVATLRRLTVKTEYQNCGLSTLLIDRAMSFANEKGLERVEAVTNELETKAADILKKHHGFKLVKKDKKGWFGQYEKTWSCDVKEWMTAHQESAKTYQKAEKE
jgi:N-acetylglutamate synthase-like GNAT family acetyltransferase